MLLTRLPPASLKMHLASLTAVVETPVLQSLLSTPDAWLLNLMECFSKGDVNGYNKVMAASKSQFDSQPALKNKATFIHEKITLLALVDMVFTRER